MEVESYWILPWRPIHMKWPCWWKINSSFKNFKYVGKTNVEEKITSMAILNDGIPDVMCQYGISYWHITYIYTVQPVSWLTFEFIIWQNLKWTSIVILHSVSRLASKHEMLVWFEIQSLWNIISDKSRPLNMRCGPVPLDLAKLACLWESWGTD